MVNFYLGLLLILRAAELYFLIWISLVFFQPKCRKRFIYSIYFILILGTWILLFMIHKTNFQFIIFIEFLMLNLIFIKGSLIKKTIFVFSILILQMITNFLFLYVSKQLNQNSAINIMNPSYYPWALSSCLLYSVILGTIGIVYMMKKKEEVLFSSLIFFILFAVIFIILLLHNYHNIIEIEELFQFLFAYLFIMIVYILFFNNCLNQINVKYMEKQYRFAKQEVLIRQGYYEEILISQKKTQQMHHDMKYHLNTIKSLYQANKALDAIRYVEELEADWKKYDSITKSGNPIVDIIIKDWLNMAQEAGIKVKTLIQLPYNLPLSMLELSILIGNTFSNAIEACQKETNCRQQIECSFWIEHSMLTYHITNTFTKEIRVNQQNKILTTKKNKNLHGFGLMNVQEVIEKHNGFCSMQYTEGLYQFTASIPIQ